MTTAAIYARKSKLTEKGDSIENQIKLCKNHLDNLGIDDYLIYRDEGFSGKNTDRPEFTKMLDDARKNKFTVLICYKLDRVSRSVADFSNFVSEIEKLGISFISLNEQFDTASAMGRAMMYICSVFAQLERETISLRVRDNMYSLAEFGNWLGGEVPTGFQSERISYIDDSSKERTHCILKPIKEEVELVRLVYDKYLELKSLSKVEKYMLSNNIKTKNNKDWSKSGLRSILTNPAYVRADLDVVNYFKASSISIHGNVDSIHGITTYSKRKGKQGKYKDPKDWIYAVAEHEGLINSEDWLGVQKQININKSKAPALGSSNLALLSGLVRCDKCNNYMRIAYGKQYANSNIKKFYYVCSLKRNSGNTRCNMKNVSGVDLDNIIIEKLKEMSVDKSILVSELQKYKSDIQNSKENLEYKNIHQSIKQNKTMLDNLVNNVSLTTDNETVKILFNKINELKEQNKFLEKRLNELKDATEAQATIINSCDSFMKIIRNFSMVSDIASLEEKRKLISSVIEKVYVNGNTGKVSIKFWGVDGID